MRVPAEAAVGVEATTEAEAGAGVRGEVATRTAGEWSALPAWLTRGVRGEALGAARRAACVSAGVAALLGLVLRVRGLGYGLRGVARVKVGVRDRVRSWGQANARSRGTGRVRGQS